MKRGTYHTTISVGLGLGLALGLLYALNTHRRPALAAPSNLFVRPASRFGTCTMSQPCPLQIALNKAIDGDSIYLAGGTYTGSGGAVVTLTKSISLYGGWNGLVSKLPVRNPETFPSILDGEGQRRVVYISGNYTPTLDGLRITNGSAGISGGGGINSELAHPIINHCHIYSNTAGDDGGGIYLGNADRAQLTENEIYSNTASAGGGVYVTGGEGVIFTNNDVYLNTATDTGGGVCFMGSTDATLENNSILWNQADVAGGGVLLFGSLNVNLINNVVASNRIFPTPGQGAGIALQNTTSHFLHTTIARNLGGNAQGVYVVGIASTARMTNTILVGHSVGIATSGSAVTMTHTLWGLGTWANGVDTAGSNIYTGTTSIRQDPAFADPLAGDYHLTLGSPAIDAGTDTGVGQDVDGDARPWPTGGVCDIGADEMPYRLVYLPSVLRND